MIKNFGKHQKAGKYNQVFCSNMASPPLFRAEQFSLLVLALTLPALEAPKNIAAVFFLAFWLLARLHTKDWGGKASIWDVLGMSIIVGAVASTQFGLFPPEKGVNAAGDSITFVALFLALRRSNYSPGFLRVLCVALLAGTLATLAYGYWGLLVTHERKTLGLHSVGHVNHSAIYIALAFSLALSWATTATAMRPRLAAIALAVTLLISLFVSEARGALIPAIAFTVLYLGLQSTSPKKALQVGLLTVACLAAITLALPGVIEKTRSNYEQGQTGSYRPALARTALLALEANPAFGVGVNNFGKIDAELTAAWQQQGSRLPFSPEGLWYASHAHNLYFNTLAERGLVGAIPVFALLILIGAMLWRQRPDTASPAIERRLWGAALGAWTLMVLGGGFNTTLHHENAIFSMMMFAIWLQCRRQAT